MAETLGLLYSLQKGSTLKVTVEFNIHVKQTSFYKYCPGTFGYILVYNITPTCFGVIHHLQGVYKLC